MTANAYETNRRMTFLILPIGADLSVVPEAVINRLKPGRFLKTIDLSVVNMVGANPLKIVEDMKNYGYAIASSEISIEIK